MNQERLKLSDHGDPVWDCTFHYSVRPRVYTKNAVDTPNIKLITNTEGYIEGFDILVNNTSIPSGEEERDKLGNCLEKILTIKSGMTVDAWTTGYRCKDRVTGHSHRESTLTTRWSRHGWIDVLDLNDQSIQNVLNSGTSPDLENLSHAVSHLNEGRYQDCINRAFGIIERDISVKDYWKFNCIRNILTHDDLKSHVTNDFTKYFGPNVHDAFDFKKYDPNNGIINLDFESKKTRNTLNNVATDLVNECKRILGL
jgi:hypothetical protein